MFSKLHFLVLLILFQTSLLLSQQEVVASVGSDNNLTGKVEYVIGHTYFNTLLSSGDGSIGNIFETFHEFTVLDVNNVTKKYKLHTYPNPTTDFLNIKIFDTSLLTEKLSFILFDINGKKIKSGSLINEISRINLKLLPEATYLFTLKRSGKVVFFTRILKK